MVKSLLAQGAGVHVEQVQFFIPHHPEDVRMPADEQIRGIFAEGFPHAPVVAARIAANVGHPHFHAFQGEALVLGPVSAYLMVVYIAVHGPYRRALGQAVGEGEGAYIPGVPDLIRLPQQALGGAVEQAVGIADEGDLFQAGVWVPLPAK